MGGIHANPREAEQPQFLDIKIISEEECKRITDFYMAHLAKRWGEESVHWEKKTPDNDSPKGNTAQNGLFPDLGEESRHEAREDFSCIRT